MAGDSVDTRSAPVAVDLTRSSSGRANGRSARTISKGLVGFIGLGSMGTAMAANLAAGGRRVVAYVRHPERLSELKALGLTSTTNIGDLFDCEFVVSMLPNDDTLRQVVFGSDPSGLDGLALRMGPGAIHLSMSTISTMAASQLAAEHARHGQGYVAAPVFGNPDAARARELYIIAAGASGDIERCRPLFDILGQQTFSVGSDPSAANLIKLAGNMMTATTLEVLGEVISLIRKHGLNPETFIDILTATMFGGRVHRILRGQDRRPSIWGRGICTAPGVEGRMPGSGRGRERGRSHALSQYCARSTVDRDRPGLCRVRLDCASPDCGRGRGLAAPIAAVANSARPGSNGCLNVRRISQVSEHGREPRHVCRACCVSSS